MSDTPETDKEWRHPASFDGSERVVHISVAQKRERERDEAREELAEAKREAENLAKSIYRSEYSDNDTDWELLDSVAGVISQIDNMYAGVREQRDEAREEVEHWKDSLKLLGETPEQVFESWRIRHTKMFKYIRIMAAWREKYNISKRERDNAMKEAEYYRERYNQLKDELKS